ncbi:hypothetical protein BDW62DRAFT_172855 [Aspergillus aurantiobrunneus]
MAVWRCLIGRSEATGSGLLLPGFNGFFDIQGHLFIVRSILPMAPLRAHTKSRTGCLQCKKRRVKCDENGHPCGNCAFRNVKCEYPNPSTTASSAEPARPNPVPQQGSPDIPEVHPPVAGLTSPNKLLLELMHKFSTETYKSLVSEPSDLHVWQTVIPRRALDHDFLLDGILSVAALHTASTVDPPAARPYLDAAMAFQSRASQPFQTAIENISPENCDAVFAYSMLITVNGIAFPRMTLGAATAETSTVLDNLFLTFELVQGTAEISKLTGPWLKKSSLAPEDFWRSSSEHALDNGTDQALSRLNELNYRENLHWPEKFGILRLQYPGCTGVSSGSFISRTSPLFLPGWLPWTGTLWTVFGGRRPCRCLSWFIGGCCWRSWMGRYGGRRTRGQR